MKAQGYLNLFHITKFQYQHFIVFILMLLILLNLIVLQDFHIKDFIILVITIFTKFILNKIFLQTHVSHSTILINFINLYSFISHLLL